MAIFRPELEICPCCKRKGDCRVHAYYSRYILDFRHGKPCCVQARIMRVMCSCGHTHAILPDFIIPYRQHSLKFLLQILFACYARHKSISALCQHFQVEPSFAYRLKELYEEHKKLWLGSMADASTSQTAFLRSLFFWQDISDFLHAFYKRTSFSFLQSHRNPAANCDGCGLGR